VPDALQLLQGWPYHKSRTYLKYNKNCGFQNFDDNNISFPKRAHFNAPLRHTQLSGKPLPNEVAGKTDAAFQVLQELCQGKTFLVCLDDVVVTDLMRAMID
jgi:hypothetical protein